MQMFFKNSFEEFENLKGKMSEKYSENVLNYNLFGAVMASNLKFGMINNARSE